MTPENWRDLLGTWSRVILDVKEYRREFPREVVTSGWLGFPGATEEEIAAAEERLGIILPPSYRTFLGVTNGWRTTKTFVGRLRPVEAIGWYRDDERSAVAVWWGADQTARVQHNIPTPLLTTGDWLSEALAVSDYRDGIYLLVPRAVVPGGEWRAWFFAPWVPGEREYQSFWDLMVQEYESFLSLSSSNNGGPRRVGGRRPPIRPFRPAQ